MAISTNSTGARMNEAPNLQHAKANEAVAEINGIRVEKSVIINRIAPTCIIFGGTSGTCLES